MDYKKFYNKHRQAIKGVLVLLIIVVMGVVYVISLNHKHQGDKETFDNSFSYSDDFLNSNALETIGESKNGGIYVYICGAVNNSGVYECTKESRVYELLEMAGGATEEADLSQLNLARTVTDGEKIYVVKQGEALPVQETERTMVNINQATVEQLMTLPGIGESRARDIVNYRKNNGNYKTAEDIMNVSGIKEAAFLKIKDMICV